MNLKTLARNFVKKKKKKERVYEKRFMKDVRKLSSVVFFFLSFLIFFVLFHFLLLFQLYILVFRLICV